MRRVLGSPPETVITLTPRRVLLKAESFAFRIQHAHPDVRLFRTYGPVGERKERTFAPMGPLRRSVPVSSAKNRRSRRLSRFTRNNGIIEGFHNKLEKFKRQACGLKLRKRQTQSQSNALMKSDEAGALKNGVGPNPGSIEPGKDGGRYRI